MKNIETNEQKPIFYVFTGIENTLISKNFLNEYYKGGPAFVYEELKPDPNCMQALNTLIEKLEAQYDVRLIITSKKRAYPVNCENYLYSNGLKYNKPIFYTKYVSGPRGEKIVDFLESQGAEPLEFHKMPFYVRILRNLKNNPDFDNYVVIEGGKNLSKYIPQKQIIKVQKRDGLTMDQVGEFLDKREISLEQ